MSWLCHPVIVVSVWTGDSGTTFHTEAIIEPTRSPSFEGPPPGRKREIVEVWDNARVLTVMMSRKTWLRLLTGIVVALNGPCGIVGWFCC